ncbi:MAG: mitochondrial fission ELM1 family protein [Rhodospirillales bacterium]|nr:mitochondrial fission ELM1 family protein [Rhodospirillales bacterium]
MTTCWIVTEDGLTGTENQCLGVAEAMGVMPIVKRIGLRWPWRILSPWLGFEQGWTFTGDALDGPYPDLLIAAGRKAIAAARYIKKQSSGKTFTVFLQDPRINPKQFDLVAVPAHDPTRGDNVIVTTATPNRITPERLATAKEEWDGQFSGLPSPRVAVMIGGSSKAYDMTPEITKHLAEQLKEMDASLMITASRRTGETNRALLHEILKDREHMFFWDGHGDNPYFGMLAWADYLLVTADSASMLSEAATTGKPVYMIPLAGGTKRFDIFHKNLLESGLIRKFNGNLESWTYKPLRDAHQIGEAVWMKINANASKNSGRS